MTPKSFPGGCDSSGDGWRDSLGPVFDGLPATVNDLTFQTPSDPRSNYRFNEIFTISESPWMWPNSVFSIFRVNNPLTPIWGCDCTINSNSFWPPFLSHPHPHDSSQYLHRTPNPPWRQTLRIIVLGDTSLSFRGHIRLGVMTQRSSKPKPRNPLPFRPSDMMMDPRRSPLWISCTDTYFHFGLQQRCIEKYSFALPYRVNKISSVVLRDHVFHECHQ